MACLIDFSNYSALDPLDIPSGRTIHMVLTWTGKMRESFPVREFLTDWKRQGILPQMLEKLEHFIQNTGVRKF